MPHKEIEADDPMELVGVVLPAGAEAMRDMAYAFAEEFARMGYAKAQLLRLFQNPFYAGAYGAYRTLGEKKILEIIEDCVNVWGRLRIAISDRPSAESELKADRRDLGAGWERSGKNG